MVSGQVRLRGDLSMKVKRAPRAPWSWRLRNWLRWPFLVGLVGWVMGHGYMRLFGAPVLLGRLEARLIRKDGSVINYGTLGFRVVTTAFVTFLVDQLQTETSVFGDFKYHDSGVGATAENASDTDMQTTDGESRVTGTQTEASATVYQSVGTIAYTTTKAITEHGLFNASTGVTLMDRTVFSAINVVSGDSIQFTYSLTCSAGG
jgi:hypothetical protein